MGNSCCRAESPCGSAEERSGLLKDDSKVTVPTGDTLRVGTCGPDGDEDIRKSPNEGNIKVEEDVQLKRSPEVADVAPSDTQENGPMQKDVIESVTPSSKGSEVKENSTRVQDEDMKDRHGDGGQAEVLQCTLNSLQKEHTVADWKVLNATTVAPEETSQASAQDDVSLTAEGGCPENQTETDTEREHVTVDTAHGNDEEEAGSVITAKKAVAEPSGEFVQNNEASSVPNPQLAAAAWQTSATSVVSQENDEAASCAVTEDPEKGSSSVRKESSPEVTGSHHVCESSPGSEPTGVNHSGEERDAAKCVRVPETTAPADASDSLNCDQDAQPDVECSTTKEVTSSENIKQDIGEEMKPKGQDKDGDVPKAKVNNDIKEEVENTSTKSESQAGNDTEIQEETGEEQQLTGSTSTEVKADEMVVTEEEGSAEDGLENSEEDLYRGAEELSETQKNQPETTLLKVEDRCSLAPAVDILSYSEREWKGNTAKSALIRKGYKEMSQRFGSVRRVRGDNYCALRATLFQVLSHSTQLPAWLQDDHINMLMKRLEAEEGLISQWVFPGECLQADGTGDTPLQLKGYMELLLNKWQAAVDCSSAAERQQLCERVFQGGQEELGLLEALKLLMLGRALELHGCMQGGADVPLFCWLLFARDSSDCPRSFLANHLSHVGLSAGLEQVEMFLLGYALQCTIQVYRLYKADTEEFVTYYPDDHKDDWPSVCLVTEDDRHYNVPVVEAADALHQQLNWS